jgi:hypothetical protein
MSAMPVTVLRPLAFPSRVAALVCLRTGRVLAFVPAAPARLADTAKSTRHPRDINVTSTHISA